MAARPGKPIGGNKAVQGNSNGLDPQGIHPMLDTFRLVAESKRQAARVAESARGALKAFYRNPEELALFIERHGTPVIVLGNASNSKRLLNSGFLSSFVLWALGFEPGFIPPGGDRRYRLLEAYLGMVHLKDRRGDAHERRHLQHGVFVMTRPLFTVGFLSHQMHHWLAYRSGMKGYSEREQALYKQFWCQQGGVIGEEVYDMTADDIRALKEAINRDMEALTFLRDIAYEILVPAKQAAHFATGNTMA